MIFKKHNPVGLDIGSSYIKIARIDDTKAGYELALFDMQPVQSGIINEGLITDKDRLVNIIKELLKRSGIKKGDAVICVSGHSSVVIKTISLPVMTEEELSSSIKYEAEQYIPFDINEVNIDFQIIGMKEEGQMDVTIVAVKKDVMNDYIDVVKRSGLDIAIVDTDSFAIYNAYEVNYDMTEKNSIALINIGDSITNINIVHDGIPIFTRYSAIGSHLHTDSLEKALGVSREDAERLKRGQSIENISPDIAQEIIRSASDEIYGEIYRSFEYYRSSIGEEEINKIVLSGGASLIKGFPENMAERIGIPVEVIDPFRNIKVSERLDKSYIKDIAPIATIAVGLALRRIGDR